MSQQNSTNNQNLLNVTIQTPQYKSVKVTNFLRKERDEDLYTAQSINNENSKEFILKFYQTMKESEKAFIQTLMDNQRQSDTGIVTIVENFQYNTNQVLLMEMGTLNVHDYIQTQSNLTIEQRIEICNDLFTPIKFMHSKQLFHKDLKPESFIIVGNRFKLIDFGLMIKGIDQNKNQTIRVEQNLYSAPEIDLQTYEYSEKVDTWALGCIIYEILSGKSFFVKQEDIKCQISQYQQQQDSQHKKIEQLKISEQLQRTLKQMLEPNPQKRISIFEASQAFINKQSKTQFNPVQQTQMYPVQQTQFNPVQQTQMYPVQQTQFNPVQQTQFNPVLQTQMNPVLQTQTNPVLQTQMNPVLQTQMNPVLQTQTNPVLQTQTNPVLQTQMNPVQQYKSTYQQPNQNLQQPTQSQASPFQQQNTQKQQLSQAHIEQVCQLLLDEIKKQISKNQNQNKKIEDKDVKNQIRENDSKQSQNNVENVFNGIIKIIHNSNKKVQEIQVQQIQEIHNQYELNLENKDKEIDCQKQQLEDKQREIQQQVESKNQLDQNNKTLQSKIQEQQIQIQEFQKKILEQEKQIQEQEKYIQEQQNLNYLVDQVIKRFNNYLQNKQQNQQEKYQHNEQEQNQNNNEEETLFLKLHEELKQKLDIY